ncbi:MAG: hypothetical protein M3383_06150, partial [Actinomycetota bacterium]|nr:hypothetical protein [Actinomycetota bacterium]
LGAIAVEPGNQAGYPAEHEDRHFMRISAVLNCEVFGVPVEPGCLAGALAAARRGDAPAGDPGERSGAKRAATSGRPRNRPVTPFVPPIEAPGAGRLDLSDLLDPGRLRKGIDDIRNNLGRRGPGGAPKRPAAGGNLSDLLDFLLDD